MTRPKTDAELLDLLSRLADRPTIGALRREGQPEVTLSIDDLRRWDEQHHGPFSSEPVADIGEIDLSPFVRGEAPETKLEVLYREPTDKGSSISPV